jgi:hypothetical protein
VIEHAFYGSGSTSSTDTKAASEFRLPIPPNRGEYISVVYVKVADTKMKVLLSEPNKIRASSL